MKLGNVHEGRLVAADDRRILVEAVDGGFEMVGRLPLPSVGVETLRFLPTTTRPWKPLLERVVGRFPTVNAWRFDGGNLVATTGRWAFHSGDDGATWAVSRRLPRSSGPMGVLPSAVCRHDGAVYLGEYPLDPDVSPAVLRSDDGGRSWSTYVELPDVRHVHAVQSDPFSGELWATTGDVDAACRIGRLRDGAFEPVGGGSQRWRAVGLAFTPDAVLWGMDCVYASANDILRLDRDALDRPDPEPEAVCSLPNSVYYGQSLPVDGEHVVAFSTAVETGADSTAAGRRPRGDDVAAVVAASSASGYTDWTAVATYRRGISATDRWNPGGRLPTPNTYVFLAADPERGLFVNPYHTAVDDGEIDLVSIERLAAVAAA